jgi:hypothetical protein
MTLWLPLALALLSLAVVVLFVLGLVRAADGGEDEDGYVFRDPRPTTDELLDRIEFDWPGSAPAEPEPITSDFLHPIFWPPDRFRPPR